MGGAVTDKKFEHATKLFEDLGSPWLSKGSGMAASAAAVLITDVEQARQSVGQVEGEMPNTKTQLIVMQTNVDDVENNMLSPVRTSSSRGKAEREHNIKQLEEVVTMMTARVDAGPRLPLEGTSRRALLLARNMDLFKFKSLGDDMEFTNILREAMTATALDRPQPLVWSKEWNGGENLTLCRYSGPTAATLCVGGPHSEQ